MRVGDTVRILGKLYEVELVNDCRARVQPLWTVEVVKGGKKINCRPPAISISPGTEVDVVRPKLKLKAPLRRKT